MSMIASPNETTIGQYLEKELGVNAKELEALTRTEDGRKLRSIDEGDLYLRWRASMLNDGDLIRIGKLLFLKENGHLYSMNEGDGNDN